jgi:tetrahydromethanopterin S-methyltransferase subunit C
MQIIQVFTRLPAVVSAIVTLIGAVIIGFVFGWRLAFLLVSNIDDKCIFNQLFSWQ